MSSKQIAAKPAHSSHDDLVSIVIPAYNEKKHISSCLKAILNQSYVGKFEVIVVDNNSSDNTRELAAQFQNKLNLRIISEKQKGRGSARFSGFQNAKGTIILSTDADVVVPKKWLENMVTILEKKLSVVALTGPCQISDQSTWTNILFNIFQPLAMKAYRVFFGHYWLSGFNFAIRQEIYQKSGGFDPRLNSLEDIDLTFRVSRLGKIQFLPTLPVAMSGRRFQKGLLRGMLSYVILFIKYKLNKTDINLNDLR